MNKIIPLLLMFVLCSCSSQQMKTNDLSSQTLSPHSSKAPHSNADTANADEENLLPRLTRYLKQGIASWYGPKFHGKKTASGEIYDMYAMTAAHKTLPISSYARVTNLENQRSVIVRINDRGPFQGNRLMDLSYAAAKKLDLHQAGSAAVEIKAIAPEQALAQMQNAAKTQEKNVYLQVGTFGNKKKAMNLKNKIVAHHLPQPEILPSTHKGSTLYKVQMGPIKSPENAHKLNIQLAKLGITATQFVSETDQKQISMIQ
ncbi:rare lipoprotein A [Methylobacter tundripaludum]|uniref:Endolytic peptidoglycan transglycosylase RlpA n=2 Tax=Methylobacter tundripaludum TaxID=173365 RepID=A0A2S6H5S5_9GAMM|nr:rare lipoprotein A [Methylobacter tundripaludum]